ncbi:MAG: SPASM domain-containing protein [Thermoproteota archaeon]
MKLSNGKILVIDPDTTYWAITDDLAEAKKIEHEYTDGVKEELKRAIETKSKQILPTFIEFHVTEACNLNCKYCFVPEKYRQSIRMTMNENQIRNVITKVLNYVDTIEDKNYNVAISFQGGEALLCKEILMEIIEDYSDEKRLEFTFQTNATLIDEIFLDFCINKNITLGISLDGPKEMNDMTRVYPDGKGSFDRIFNTIELMKNKGIRPDVITVVTKFNVKNLSKIIQFYHKTKIQSVLLNPVEPLNKMALSLIPTFEELSSYYEKAIRSVLKINVENPQNRIIIRNVQELIMCLISDVIPRSCYMSPCGAARLMFAISASGDVYPCGGFESFPEMRLGNVFDMEINEILQSDIAKLLRSRDVNKINPCNSCAFKRLCCANCPATLYALYQDIFRPSFYSSFRRRLISSIFDLIAENIENVFKLLDQKIEEGIKLKLKDEQSYYNLNRETNLQNGAQYMS